MYIRIIYLSETNQSDRLFMRDLSAGLKRLPEKSVILQAVHPQMPDSEAWFVTKRISALLSEANIANHPIAGHHRKLITINNEQQIELKLDLFQSLWKVHDAILVTMLAAANEATVPENSPVKLSALQLVPALYYQLAHMKTIDDQPVEVMPVWFFPNNPLSLLASKAYPIEQAADGEKLLTIYPEEKTSIELAMNCRPAIVAGAKMLGT